LLLSKRGKKSWVIRLAKNEKSVQSAPQLCGVDRQKKWFEILKNSIDTPIYTARNKLVNNRFRPSFQKELGKLLPPIDHRTIGSNEIVIELDAQSYTQNMKYARQITDYCTSQDIPHLTFWSGNKSIHIHIFLKLTVSSEEGQELIKEAIKKGCNLYRDIRLALTKDIVEQAGISPSLIGIGKIVDLAKLNWDDLGGKNTLIRACGGSNKKVDKIDPTIIKGGYKTYYSSSALPLTKPKIESFEDVNYPLLIETYDVDEDLIIRIAQDYIEKSKSFKKEQLPIDYEGKYLNLPCIQKIIEGMDSGQRSYGALAISLAARMDGYDKEGTKPFIQRYVDNCSQVPEKFSFSEACDWLTWVFKIPHPYWICGHAQRVKACDQKTCELHKEQYKEELAILDEEDPLKIVKEALDILAVGEDSLKMQLFLLYLTKEFMPEWCVMIDGPASTGKTHVMKAVASLFGDEDEDYFVYSRFTKASLNHIEELAGKWSKKIVIIEELQGSKDVIEQLRVAISEGKLTLLQTQEVMLEGGMKGHKSESKIVYFDNLFVTCNAEDYDEGDQLLSRAWILSTDNSDKQTKNVMDFYLESFAKTKQNFLVPNLQSIRTALKFLQKYEIIFPFAKEMEGWMPANSPRGRRDIQKFIAMIRASAFFHQRHREKFRVDEKDYLIADWRDVRVVLSIAGEALNASTQGLSSSDIKDWDVIRQKLSILNTDEFNTEDLIRWLGQPKGTVQRKASAYIRQGFLENLNMPPLPSHYKVISNVSKLDDDYLVSKCDSFIEGQAEKIQEWLEKKGVKQ